MPLTALEVHGPYEGPTGYEHHVREFVRELHRQGVAVYLADRPEPGASSMPDHARDPWFDSLDQPVDARIALHFLMPHLVVPVPGKLNANHSVFEATQICPLWVERSLERDLVIVPTESSWRAWINSGVPPERVRVCPYGINTSLFSPLVTPAPLEIESLKRVGQHTIRFLNVSALNSRKNLLGLLRAWMRATSRHDDATLVIKLTCYNPESLRSFQRHISILQREMRKRLRDAAPVHFLLDILSDADMPRLYASFTHYISTSFGEGWDQPMMEAAASGLRLIAPDHSAYRAYLDASIASLIPSREVSIVGASLDPPLYVGASWWEPDEEHAVALIQSAIAGTDQVADSARDRIFREFTWEKATWQLVAILEELEGDSG